MFRNLFRSSPPLPSISVRDLKAKLDARESMTLVDVRQPEEFKGGHVAGARSLPLPTLATRLDELAKDAAIYCICLSGGRSQTACDLLQRQGFTNVTNVTGGMGAWQQAGLPSKRG
ncbi:MAG: rhodanese-like domain-containing protein [Chloroflexales bacterium]